MLLLLGCVLRSGIYSFAYLQLCFVAFSGGLGSTSGHLLRTLSLTLVIFNFKSHFMAFLMWVVHVNGNFFLILFSFLWTKKLSAQLQLYISLFKKLLFGVPEVCNCWTKALLLNFYPCGSIILCHIQDFPSFFSDFSSLILLLLKLLFSRPQFPPFPPVLCLQTAS